MFALKSIFWGLKPNPGHSSDYYAWPFYLYKGGGKKSQESQIFYTLNPCAINCNRFVKYLQAFNRHLSMSKLIDKLVSEDTVRFYYPWRTFQKLHFYPLQLLKNCEG